MRFRANKTDGGFVVSCRDLPEAITQGESAWMRRQAHYLEMRKHGD
jgi:hypothetical protein